ncbi:hypothetical protein VW35_00800 [Devosia soli]|uniref:Uncharacterized protein n=1 Tax=Devosia soli TaxID=361041 RepID=A0A0F5LER3_9HYPH|nr:hypothetical protein [Devosia soli]KKB80780.1 hypothetical protein VW35_00800 [Devosia soli]
MQIKNIGQDARTISRDGIDVPLLPGSALDVELTKDEAKAFEGLGFEVTGEPAKPAPKSKE